MKPESGSDGRFTSLKALRFGTSGLRGLVTEMTDLECYINTKGFLGFLRERGQALEGKPIVFGGDLRSSTPRILLAVQRAILDMGCVLDYCGLVPSPTLAYYAMQNYRPSIMVTGSHIPDDRNGIKFTKANGEVLKADEPEILEQVKLVRETEYSKSLEESLFDDEGAFKKPESLPKPSTAAADLYKTRYLNAFKNQPLTGIKLVFYQHSAVGRTLIPDILAELGAEVIRTGLSDDFIPVDTEKVSDTTKDLLVKMAADHQPFAVLSTDGDSDRPLLADERGEFLTGDKLGALAAMHLEPDFVAVPVSTNSAVVSFLKQANIKVSLTKIGSPYVIKTMLDEATESSGARLAAWEANGGFLTGTLWTIGSGVLPALPTRDALLPILSVILLAKRRKIKLSELIATKLPRRFNAADVVDNKTKGCKAYTAELGRAIVERLSPKEETIFQVNYAKDDTCEMQRRKETEPAASDEQKELLEIKKELASYFNTKRNFSVISSVNFIDGIRITFENGDTAHIRPSGNAPELRFYAESDDESRLEAMLNQKEQILSEIIQNS